MADINVSFYDVNLDRLIIERDFTDEANRMLPRLIEEFSKVTAVREWNQHQKLCPTSNSERGKFIRHAIQNYEMGTKQQEHIRKIVIEQLRERKRQYDKDRSWPSYRATIED